MYSGQAEQNMSDGNGCMDGFDGWPGSLVVFHDAWEWMGKSNAKHHMRRLVGGNESNEWKE